jgi:hypothetical protein
VQRLFIHQSLDNISWISRGLSMITLHTVSALWVVYPNQLILWEAAKHVTVCSYWSWQYLIFRGRYSSGQARIFPKSGKLLCVTDFMLQYGSLGIPFDMQVFLLWYRLVWATKMSLAAIGLVFPVLVLGYKSFNCSMYQVPVPTLIEKFVWIYFEQLLLVADSIIFWHTNSRSLQSILYQFLHTFLNLYDYPANS